jgi:hypothetical protein
LRGGQLRAAKKSSGHAGTVFSAIIYPARQNQLPQLSRIRLSELTAMEPEEIISLSGLFERRETPA